MSEERQIPDVVFVGGTGRSGTHVIARLVGRHRRFAAIPVEVRFHVEERGFPGLLAGTVTKEQFVERLRGFWWRGFQTSRMRGLYRFVPEEVFERAVSGFESGFDREPEEACRRLFFDLLSFRGDEVGAAGIVEQSCDSIAVAPTLLRLFPNARFVHVVRDGRDASASRVSQTRHLVYPRTRRQGIEWWERRIRQMDRGARALPPDRLLTVSLDEFLLLRRTGLRPLFEFLGVHSVQEVRRFFKRRMSHDEANLQRWRRGLSERRAQRLQQLYAEVLDRLEADGLGGVPLLCRTYERSLADGSDLEPLAYLVEGKPVSGVPA